MSTTSDILLGLKNGKPRRIKGQTVRRDGSVFDIDGDTLDLAGAVARLDQVLGTRGIDYIAIAFFERPPFSSRVIAQHRCTTKAQHTTLVNDTRRRNNYLYYGTVKRESGRYVVTPPFILDWDTVPEHPAEIARASAPLDPSRWGGDLSCPFCGIEVSSTPGRTLHIKAAHPERVDEYNDLLDKVSTKPAADEVVIDGEDVVDLIADKLRCPYCKHKIKSTSGKTLHIKSKHPDQFAEYQLSNT